MTEVLLVDDDDLFAISAKRFLEARGMRVTLAHTLALARAALSPHTDVIVLDRRLPDGMGEDLSAAIGRMAGQAAVLRMSAADWMPSGSAGVFLAKPFDLATLADAVRGLARDGASIFAGAGMAAVLRTAECFAQSECPIVIAGETGTGKTQLARFIHRASPRRAAPFVAVNCAALAPSIVEAELFGVERGAYTGASASRPGLFEAARGGTVLLDEVAELSPAAQAALLQVLEEHWVRRIGSTEPVAVDARIVVASHVNLLDAVRAGRLREDLYYRLDVGYLWIPPLRDRPEDLAAIVASLLSRLPGGGGARVLTDEIERLKGHPLPGNVRQLRNVLERALLLQEPGDLRPSFFLELGHEFASRSQSAKRAGEATFVTRRTSQQSTSQQSTLEEVERAHIRAVLESTGGVRSAAARILGIAEATLRRRLRA